MATAVALKKQAERTEAREAYIKHAVVSLHGDYALVTSEFAGQRYRVEIEDGGPVSCQCQDFYWGTKKNPLHQCKHQRATKVALVAAKIRRSAPRVDTIAALQVEGSVKVRKVRGQNVLRVSHNAVKVFSKCPVIQAA